MFEKNLFSDLCNFSEDFWQYGGGRRGGGRSQMIVNCIISEDCHPEVMKRSEDFLLISCSICLLQSYNLTIKRVIIFIYINFLSIFSLY